MEQLFDLFPSRLLAYFTISLCILILGYLINRLIMFTITRFFNRNKDRLDLDATSFNFFKNAASGIMLVVVMMFIFYNIPELKTIGLALFASAGIFAAVVGFASQQALSNIISGIFIVIFKPFRVQDIVTIGTNWGVIEDITLRHTVIRNFENRRLVIPNAVISQESIINSNINDERIRLNWNIGISYESNVDKAIEIIQKQAIAHPFCIDARTPLEIENNDPQVLVRLVGFGDSSINLRAYIWVDNPDKSFVLGCDMNKRVKEVFDKEGIEIPFPHRTLVFKDQMKPFVHSELKE